MIKCKQILAAYWQDDDGATAIEYGLIVALIGIALMAGAASLGDANGNSWQNISNKVGGVM